MLILASASLTRRQLLENAGFSMKAVPADIDERDVEQTLADNDRTNGKALARRLARAKAESVSTLYPDTLVIGADQTLAHNGQQLHKPKDRAAAVDQLWNLRDQTHTLQAAVALARDGAVVWTHVETARLTMRAFSRAELDDVLDLEGDAILGSVGAYRLEGPSIRLFARIEGDYFTILGLPLLALIEALRTNAPDAYTLRP